MATMATTAGPRRKTRRRTQQTRVPPPRHPIGLTVEEILAREKAEEERRRRGRITYRLRWHLLPHWAALGVAATAALLWGVDEATGHRYTGTIAATTGLVLGSVVGLVWLVAGRRLRRWRWHKRATVAAVFAVVWLTVAGATGPSWTAAATLFAADLALGAGYWRVIRIQPRPKPLPRLDDADNDDLDEDDEPEVKAPPIHRLWAQHIGCSDGVLPKSRLTQMVEDDKTVRYTVELVPGKQSFSSALTSLDKICSGLRRPPEDIMIEPHLSRDASLLQLTVVTSSPIKDTVTYPGPQYYVDGLNTWIEIGPYADGRSNVRIPVRAPKSTRHCTIIGGQGSGKTSLLDAAVLSLKSSGHVVVWYLDGQDGVSSPWLMKHADWGPTGPQREEAMLAALKRIYEARGLVMKRDGLAGIDASPEMPAIIVIIDECHVFFRPGSKNLRRWEDLIRTARKVGVAFWVATQHPSLESFGNDQIRSLLQQFTTIVLRTQGRVAKNILALDVDPADLPLLPGYGYVIGGTADQHVRTAPFRAYYLDDEAAAYWFERVQGCPLDRRSSNAAGPEYLERYQRAEEERRRIEKQLEALESGAMDLGLFEQPAVEVESNATTFVNDEEGMTLGPIPAVPSPLTVIDGGKGSEPENGLTAEDVVLEAIRSGVSTPAELMERTGYGKTHVHRALNALEEKGLIRKVGRGRYEAGIDPEQAFRDA